MVDRIERELQYLAEAGQKARRVTASNGGQPFILYEEVPTAGSTLGLPHVTDVVVPVPGGYPGSPIDLAGLPTGSPLISRVAGGANSQGVFLIEERAWQLASYHPHNNGGGPPWDQMRHGFHTYLGELIAWLGAIT